MRSKGLDDRNEDDMYEEALGSGPVPISLVIARRLAIVGGRAMRALIGKSPCPCGSCQSCAF
ncbi:MAG: hypothetical protein AAB592_04250, partial [Patescibacteria group bacterium]